MFAIAITLLVLEIGVPADSGDDLLDAFVDQWPSYLAYLVSFATIGLSWVRHNAMTHYLHGVDTVFVRLNLLLTSATVSLMWRYAVRRGLVRPETGDEEVRLLTQRLTPSLAGYAILIVLGLLRPSSR